MASCSSIGSPTPPHPPRGSSSSGSIGLRSSSGSPSSSSASGADDVTARRIWCEYALLPDGVESGVMISIFEERIAEIHVGELPPDDVEQLPGLTTAGF